MPRTNQRRPDLQSRNRTSHSATTSEATMIEMENPMGLIGYAVVRSKFEVLRARPARCHSL